MRTIPVWFLASSTAEGAKSYAEATVQQYDPSRGVIGILCTIG